MQKREIFIRPTEENALANTASMLPVRLYMFFFFWVQWNRVTHTPVAHLAVCFDLITVRPFASCRLFLSPALCHLGVPFTAATDPVLILYKELKYPSSWISRHLKWLYLVTSGSWVSARRNSIQAPENASRSYHFGCCSHNPESLWQKNRMRPL